MREGPLVGASLFGELVWNESCLRRGRLSLSMGGCKGTLWALFFFRTGSRGLGPGAKVGSRGRAVP